jgi:hypothetical protein
MLADSPELLATNINHWLHRQPQNRMVRTLNGEARAFLSNKYRRLDNHLIAEAVLPIIANPNNGLIIKSAEITAMRLYLQVVTPAISAKVRGEVIQAGFVISNSEIGHGSVWLAMLLYYLACLNGQISSTDLRKHHVGRRVGNGERGVIELDEKILSLEAKQADDKAFMLAIRDLTKNAIDETRFNEQIELVKDATKRELPSGKLMETVEELSTELGFNEEEKEGVLDRLIRGGDLTQFGLSAAVTNLANDVENYDRVIEMEKIGNTIMNYDNATWQQKVAA